MRKNGWGRALRYFIQQAQSFVLTAIAGGFLMSAYVWVLRGDEVSTKALFQMIPGSAIFVALMVLFTGEMSSATYWYSTTISFGGLRKHVFWGTLVMDGLVMMESLVFYVAMSALLHAGQTDLLYFASMFLLVEGIAKLLGLASIKWGKVVNVLMIIGVAFICGMIGFVAVYGGMSGSVVSIAAVLGDDKPQTVQWLLLAVSGVVFLVTNTGSWRIFRKYEVRA